MLDAPEAPATLEAPEVAPKTLETPEVAPEIAPAESPNQEVLDIPVSQELPEEIAVLENPDYLKSLENLLTQEPQENNQ